MPLPVARLRPAHLGGGRGLRTYLRGRCRCGLSSESHDPRVQALSGNARTCEALPRDRNPEPSLHNSMSSAEPRIALRTRRSLGTSTFAARARRRAWPMRRCRRSPPGCFVACRSFQTCSMTSAPTRPYKPWPRRNQRSVHVFVSSTAARRRGSKVAIVDFSHLRVFASNSSHQASAIAALLGRIGGFDAGHARIPA